VLRQFFKDREVQAEEFEPKGNLATLPLLIFGAYEI